MEFSLLILASTSPYRKALMERLGLSFVTQSPRFDENAFKMQAAKIQGGDLPPLQLAQQLARGKAQSLATPENCVVGADQLVEWRGQLLGKPGSAEKAMEQLRLLSGTEHYLITAVCVSCRLKVHEFSDVTRIRLRPLSEEEIASYVKLDQATDCAGAYKFEKHGISLVEELACKDPSAIEGLPLIQLGQTLRQIGGFDFFTEAQK
ncbi:MAG: septum formation protein Maf [Bdellovibrio sp.]|nr:MAG: septum formation protein Maf [Bdellovibrio sp.]